jgi:hypothetical protein
MNDGLQVLICFVALGCFAFIMLVLGCIYDKCEDIKKQLDNLTKDKE